MVVGAATQSGVWGGHPEGGLPHSGWLTSWAKPGFSGCQGAGRSFRRAGPLEWGARTNGFWLG